MGTALLLQPILPPVLVVSLALVVAGLVIVVYRRAPGRWWVRYALAAIRLTAIAALVIILLRPMRLDTIPREADKPIFNVLVDASASMETKDVDGRSRAEALAKALDASRATLEQRLGDRYEIKCYTFSNRTQPATLDSLAHSLVPQGAVTDLSGALVGAAIGNQERLVAGVLLLSDGRDNAGSNVTQAATLLKSANTPVWTATVGSDTQANDVNLTARLSQDYLFVNQPATLAVAISQSGYANQYAQVRLYREDSVTETQQVLLKEGETSLEFPLKEDHKGMVRYRVQVDPLPGEAEANNNRRTVFARVVDAKSKVLVVESQPYWDTKFLVEALRHDQHLDITSIFQLSHDKVYAVSSAAPTASGQDAKVSEGVRIPRTRAELFQYDCVIFGRGIDDLFTTDELTLLKDYVVERGGSIVFARGKASRSGEVELAGMEPLEWDDESLREMHLELTPEGRVNPAFEFGEGLPADTIIRELPDLVSVTRVKAEKSLSVILARSKGDAEGEPIAAIGYQRYGKGKVMSIGAIGLWRWALTPPDLAQHGQVYARFWTQMVQWLISESDFLPGQEISFHTDRYTYALGDQVRLTVNTRFVDSRALQPQAAVTSPSGKQFNVPLERQQDDQNAYAATYVPEEEGEYSSNLAGVPGKQPAERAAFTVYSESVEKRYVAANPDLMRQIAEISGGQTLALDQLSQLPDRMNEFERQSRVEVKPKDAWDTLPIFLAIIAVLAVEWFLRRRGGMV